MNRLRRVRVLEAHISPSSIPSIPRKTQRLDSDSKIKASPYTSKFHAWPKSSLAPKTLWRTYGSFGNFRALYRHCPACSVDHVNLRYSMVIHVQVSSCIKPALCHASPLLRSPFWDRLGSRIQDAEVKVTLTVVFDARTSSSRGFCPSIVSINSPLQGHARP